MWALLCSLGLLPPTNASPLPRPPRHLAAGDTGHNDGKLYSVNVPLQEGMDDESYKYVYEPVMQKVGGWAGGRVVRLVGAG